MPALLTGNGKSHFHPVNYDRLEFEKKMLTSIKQEENKRIELKGTGAN